jgi:multisubunit Na+/H+ antiporter MnhE subunit
MPSLGLSAGTLTLIVLLWIVFVGGTRVDEMIVGAGVSLLSCAFFYQVWRTEDLRIDLRFQDVIQGWRIPWYICAKTVEIAAVFAKDLFRIKRAGSYYRVAGFTTTKSDPRLIARRVLAIFYTTMAPNFIVIGIDHRQNRMLFHQIERTSISKMTQALGAHPRRRRQ